VPRNAIHQKVAFLRDWWRQCERSEIGHIVKVLYLIRVTTKGYLKPGPHQQQCRSNIRLCSIRQCCFDIVAGVDGILLALLDLSAAFGCAGHDMIRVQKK